MNVTFYCNKYSTLYEESPKSCFIWLDVAGQRAIKTVFTAKNAERERSRVKSLRSAFQSLQSCLPSVPPNTKLSKLDVLILATNYISYLSKLLTNDEDGNGMKAVFDCDLKLLHPVKVRRDWKSIVVRLLKYEITHYWRCFWTSSLCWKN